MPDFLPRRSAEMVTWSNNFDSVLNAQYESYGLSQQDAELYSQLHTAFVLAFQRANEAATNGETAMLVKRESEIALRNYTRVLAGIVRANPEVSDAQRVALGLRTRRKKPTTPQLPFDPPNLIVEHSAGRTITVQLIDPGAPSSRGMAKGTTGVRVFSFVGDDLPAPGERWKLQKFVSKARFKITFDARFPAGAKVWLSARWSKRTGEVGPGSAPVCTHVGFAEIPLAA